MHLRVEKHGAARAGERVRKSKTGSGGADMAAHCHGGNPESLVPFEAAPGLSFVLSGKPTITVLAELWKGRARDISIRCHLGEDFVAWGLGSVFPSLSHCLFLVLPPQYPTDLTGR